MTVKRLFVNNNLNIGKFLAVQKLGETIAHFLVISNTPSLTSVVCPSYSFVTIHYRILQQIQDRCEEYMIEKLDSENSIGAWKLAQGHGCSSLTERAFQFILHYFEPISKSDDGLSLISLSCSRTERIYTGCMRGNRTFSKMVLQ
jgi:hypothetical protein